MFQGSQRQTGFYDLRDSIPPICLNGDNLETMLLQAATQTVENGTLTGIPGYVTLWRADRDR